MAATPALPTPAERALADLYLHVQTRTAGKVKGEATAEGFVDDIELLGWHWGLTSSSGVGATAKTSRRAYTAFEVTKRIDRATTALMSALQRNDEVKQLRLAMRRAGAAEPYFTIELGKGRVTALRHVAGPDGGDIEHVAFTFVEVDCQYRVQQRDGSLGGASSYSDDLSALG